PLIFHHEGLDERIFEHLNIWTRKPNLRGWQRIVNRIRNAKNSTTIAIVGKYTHLKDSYKSLHEALIHGGIANDCKVNLVYVDSEDVEKQGPEALLKGMKGVLVPGGFGTRGIEGKIKAARFAREKRIPYFGICLGMQIAVIEFAVNVVGLKGAYSTEFDRNTPHPVISLLTEWVDQNNQVQKRSADSDLGGTMRLGSCPCRLVPGTLAHQAYNKRLIHERHRHRYEFNNNYREPLAEAGLVFSGICPDGDLVEIIEVPQDRHPWFLGCQFHPEFKSRPMDPHPLFREFVKATLGNPGIRKGRKRRI
ncbi:MAG: CTP synthase, partial [Deltaproteobacteria bacterium]|nr:CTP synthase [Deltaproteobacteria bacterium]